MSKEGNDYRDEFIRAMDDLRFRLAHKDEVEVLEAGGNGLTIRDCFFNGICGYSKFHEFCLSYHSKEYEEDPGFTDEILECALRRFFDKKWEQKKYLLLACDFSETEQAKKYCAEVVKLIAAAYVGRLRELYNYHELIETDYFSSNNKYLNGGVYSKHFLIGENDEEDYDEDYDEYDDEEDEGDYE